MSTAVRSGSTASRIAKTVVLVLVLLVLWGMALGALLLPVRADVTQPPPPGNVWIGNPPTVSVECGRFWDPQTPTWPEGVQYITRGSRRAAVEACDQAYPNQRLMAIVSGGVGVLLLAMVVWMALRSRTRE